MKDPALMAKAKEQERLAEEHLLKAIEAKSTEEQEQELLLAMAADETAKMLERRAS